MAWQPPRPQPDETMEQYIARWFGTDDDGRIHCLRCGCYIRDGYQQDHYESHQPLIFF